MNKVLRVVKLKREKSLETIPEVGNRKNLRGKENFLIIKKINFNSEEISSIDKGKFNSVTEEELKKKEKKPILLSSIRTNKFSSSLNNSTKNIFSKEDSMNFKSSSRDRKNDVKSYRKNKDKNSDIVLPIINVGLSSESVKLAKSVKNINSTLADNIKTESVEKEIKIGKSEKRAKIGKKGKKSKKQNKEIKLTVEKSEINKESSLTPKKLNKSVSKYSSFNNKKSRFESFVNREKEREEFNERLSSVRKSFQDKKLHLFMNKAEKLFYVRTFEN